MHHATAVAIDVLNRAFAADPEAMHAMVCNRVPCNRFLADDPTIVVSESKAADGAFNVGMMGVVNGILGQMGAGLVAAKWEDEPRRFAGFCEYTPPERT